MCPVGPDNPSERLTCCLVARFLPSWVPKRDLEHAGGFEYLLGKCRWCGTPWMKVYCTASSIGQFERVTSADVEAIGAIHDPRELKEFMRRWGEKNL
jgi:hypothetical protein